MEKQAIAERSQTNAVMAQTIYVSTVLITIA